jgi:hypothetical protein
MNYVVNDLGKSVIAVGAPGSIMRARVERPNLLQRLNVHYWDAKAHCLPGAGIDGALELIRQAGVNSSLETNSILAASDYSEEPAAVCS